MCFLRIEKASQYVREIQDKPFGYDFEKIFPEWEQVEIKGKTKKELITDNPLPKVEALDPGVSAVKWEHPTTKEWYKMKTDIYQPDYIYDKVNKTVKLFIMEKTENFEEKNPFGTSEI